MERPILAYWDIRCLAESIRLMLHYAGINFEDKHYPTGDAPTYDRHEWESDKFSLGFDFPNLPYWIDKSDNVKLTESWAISKHIARKTKTLYPKTDLEMMKCDMLEGVIEQFRYGFIDMCYSKNAEIFERLKKKFLSSLFPDLSKFEKFMGDNKWLVCDEILYVDFVFCEVLDQIRMFMPEFLKNHHKISQYLENFDEIEQISTYRASDLYHPLPINSKYAYWGGGLKL